MLARRLQDKDTANSHGIKGLGLNSEMTFFAKILAFYALCFIECITGIGHFYSRKWVGQRAKGSYRHD